MLLSVTKKMLFETISKTLTLYHSNIVTKCVFLGFLNGCIKGATLALTDGPSDDTF